MFLKIQRFEILANCIPPREGHNLEEECETTRKMELKFQ